MRGAYCSTMNTTKTPAITKPATEKPYDLVILRTAHGYMQKKSKPGTWSSNPVHYWTQDATEARVMTRRQAYNVHETLFVNGACPFQMGDPAKGGWQLENVTQLHKTITLRTRLSETAHTDMKFFTRADYDRYMATHFDADARYFPFIVRG